MNIDQKIVQKVYHANRLWFETTAAARSFKLDESWSMASTQQIMEVHKVVRQIDRFYRFYDN